MDTLQILGIMILVYIFWCWMNCGKSGYDKPLVGNRVFGAMCQRNEQCISGSCVGGTCI